MALTVRARKASRHVRTAVALMRHVRNWREVCLSWSHTRDPGPPLVFRRGFVIQGGLQERSLQGFDSVFRDHHYSFHLHEPDVGELIDIGANIGALSLDWLSRKPAVKVHAYEPSSGTVELLRISSTAATAFAARGSTGETFLAKTVGLDEVVGRCTQTESLALVKIDTEGAEAEILEGASHAILARIQQFIIEYHDFRVPGSLERCAKVLANNGFGCTVRPTGGAVGLLYAVRRAV